MDIEKEREAFENHLKKMGKTDNETFSKNEDDSYQMDIIHFGWKIWQAAKAQAVPEWFDYTKQSPQMDGNYQIFIKGEQITAKWVSRFGFADPIEGDALRQELITHWAMQPQSPKAQEPAKAQAVPEGFVLVSAEQLSQWGHMANYAEQYGCPECFEARGYAHSLACEINEFFAIEAQEPAND